MAKTIKTILVVTLSIAVVIIKAIEVDWIYGGLFNGYLYIC